MFILDGCITLWSINGNAHYHNPDKILIKMKIIFWLRLHRTW